MRFHLGPGYRIYYLQQGDVLVLLLVGGDKSTQSDDINKAKHLADELRKEKRWP